MANQQHLMHESDLPEDLEFVQREPLTTGSAAPPVQQGMDRYQGAILSAPLGLDTDIARSQLPGANPAYRLMPPSIAGNPASNAAIQSTAAKTIAVTPGPSTTVSGEIELIVPSIFTPTDQTVTLPGPLSFGLAAEPVSTFLKTTGPGLGGFQALGQASATSSSALSISVTATPVSTSTFGLFFGIANDIWSVASGWSTITTGNEAVWYKTLSGTSPVTISDSFGVGGSAIGSLAIFNGPSPAFVQASHAATQSGSLAYTSNNTAGNTLIVVLQCYDFTGNEYGLSISDSKGNSYQQFINQRFPIVGANPDLQQAVFIATNCAGGANTVTFNYSGKVGIGAVFVTTISEFGPLPSGSSIPFFGPLTGSDIPPINLSSSGNGGVAGVLPPTNGGTGATTLTAHGVLVGEGTSAIVATAVGTAGQVLTSNGPGVDPSFKNDIVQTATTSLSSAQILALLGTPVTLVAAPGAGLTIQPLSISIILFGGSAAYTDAGGGAVSFNVGSASQALASNAVFTTATSPNKQIQRVGGFSATDTAGNPPSDDNAALTISKATSNFAAGNGTAKVVVQYIIMATT